MLRRIVIPLALPGFGAVAIFGFVTAWGSFIVPLVLISSSQQITAPIDIYSFIGSSDVDYGAIAAFSVLYSVPVLLLYLAMSRLFKGGFVLGGGVKG
jgi:multiple sugar transport system permease protein